MYCIFNYHWVNADHVIWAHAVGANRFCYFSSWRLQYMWSYGPVLLFSLIWKSFQHSNTLSPLTFKSLGNTQHIHGSQASITGSISHVPLNLSILLLISHNALNFGQAHIPPFLYHLHSLGHESLTHPPYMYQSIGTIYEMVGWIAIPGFIICL